MATPRAATPDASDPAAQYRAATHAVAVFDLPDLALFEVRGDDRLSFLHNFCTNDIKRLQPGTGCEAFLTSIKGRVLGHLRVFATTDALLVVCERDATDAIVAHLDKYLITEDVQLRSRADDDDLLSVSGPAAEAWLRESCTTSADWPPFSSGTLEIAGAAVTVLRCDLTRQPGFLLAVPHGVSADVRDWITATGVLPAGPPVFEALRIEAGAPRSGIDIGELNLAQEAGRTPQAISFTKGCYLGQEPIARLDALGHVNQELRSVAFEPGPTPAPGTPVQTAEGEPVGTITSSAISYAEEPHPVALALLRARVTSPDTCVTVTTANGVSLTGRVFWHPAEMARR